MLKPADLKTLLEYVDVKIQSAYEQLKEDPDFRGPIGVAGMDGHDGEAGPQGAPGERGARGPAGPLPNIQISEDKAEVRFQLGTLLNEETGESEIKWSRWVNLEGKQGPQGPQGERGLPGERGMIGEQGPQGIPGDKGDPLTWQDLTESQIQQLRGPQGAPGERGPIGEQGPAGRDGQTPLVESVGTRIRLQKGTILNESTGVAMPEFTDWIDIKGERGDQGPSGPEGRPGKMPKVQMEDGHIRIQTGNVINEDTGEATPTWSEWMDITGPEGKQGPEGKPGKPGPIGEQGPAGKDYDLTLFEAAKKEIQDKAVKEFQSKVKALRTEMDQMLTNKVQELSSKAETLYNKRNIEMTVPIGAIGGTDNFQYDNSLLQQIVYQTSSFYPDSDGMGHTTIRYASQGTPVYIDSPIKAAVRQVEIPGSPSYNPNMYIGIADNRFTSTTADALLIPSPDKKAVLLMRNGIMTIDPSIVRAPVYDGTNGIDLVEWLISYKAPGVTDGYFMIPGEYYFLDQDGYITPNAPDDSEQLIRQYIGQAISQTQMYVEIQKFAFDRGSITPIPPSTTPALYYGSAPLNTTPDSAYVLANFQMTSTFKPDSDNVVTIGGVAGVANDNRWVLVRNGISANFAFDWGYFDPSFGVWNSAGNITPDSSTTITINNTSYTMYLFGNAIANRVLQLRITG